jgi:hypothetical protein
MKKIPFLSFPFEPANNIFNQPNNIIASDTGGKMLFFGEHSDTCDTWSAAPFDLENETVDQSKYEGYCRQLDTLTSLSDQRSKCAGCRSELALAVKTVLEEKPTTVKYTERLQQVTGVINEILQRTPVFTKLVPADQHDMSKCLVINAHIKTFFKSMPDLIDPVTELMLSNSSPSQRPSIPAVNSGYISLKNFFVPLLDKQPPNWTDDKRATIYKIFIKYFIYMPLKTTACKPCYRIAHSIDIYRAIYKVGGDVFMSMKTHEDVQTYNNTQSPNRQIIISGKSCGEHPLDQIVINSWIGNFTPDTSKAQPPPNAQPPTVKSNAQPPPNAQPPTVTPNAQPPTVASVAQLKGTGDRLALTDERVQAVHFIIVDLHISIHV